MFKSYVGIKDGKTAGTIGGIDLEAEDAQQMLGVAEIRELPHAEAVPEGMPLAAFDGDWRLKSPEDIAKLGYDEEGNKLPTAEETAAREAQKTAEEKTEQERQERESLEEEARRRTGHDELSAPELEAEILKIKKLQLQNEIMASADIKQRAAYRAVLLQQIPDIDRWQISEQQIKRYEVKTKIARDPQNKAISAAEKGQIIAAYEASEKVMEPLIVLIDACRRVLQYACAAAKADEELDTVRSAMTAAEEFTSLTPQSAMDAWADTLGGWREAV